MAAYPIVVILWADHQAVSRGPMMKIPEKEIPPTLTVGILYRETPKTYIIIHDIERYEDHDESSYLVVYKSCVISMKIYGSIKIKKLK